MPPVKVASRNATTIAVLRALADPTRLALLARIGRSEVCVCELQGATRRDQPTVSRHLARLRAEGLVTARREGRWMRYRRASLPASLAALVNLAAGTAGRRGKRDC